MMRFPPNKATQGIIIYCQKHQAGSLGSNLASEVISWTPVGKDQED